MPGPKLSLCRGTGQKVVRLLESPAVLGIAVAIDVAWCRLQRWPFLNVSLRVCLRTMVPWNLVRSTFLGSLGTLVCWWTLPISVSFLLGLVVLVKMSVTLEQWTRKGWVSACLLTKLGLMHPVEKQL